MATHAKCTKRYPKKQDKKNARWSESQRVCAKNTVISQCSDHWHKDKYKNLKSEREAGILKGRCIANTQEIQVLKTCSTGLGIFQKKKFSV